jgi:estrogen-related receptor beta like 1
MHTCANTVFRTFAYVHPQVCVLLNEIAQCALKSARFSFKRPVIREDNIQDEMLGDDNDELRISRLEDEILDEGGDDSDGVVDEGGAFLDFTTVNKQKSKEGFPTDLVDDMLQPSVDATAWQMEVERVLPHLKVTIRNDHRDWRSHYEQLHQHKDSIDDLFTANKGQLDKLSSDISKTLEKIASREKYINSQLEHQIEEYRASQNRLAEEREHYKQGSSSVNELTLQLQQITEELETVKAQMDERGTSMTDAGPLVKIKQSLTKLKAECLQMDLKAAVVEHTLLEAQVKNKNAMHLQMNTTDGNFDVEY